MVVAAAAAARPRAFERALPWILGGVFLAAGYGLLQRLGADPLGWRPEADSPPTAPLAGTNHAAELLLLALVSAAAWPAPGRGRWLWLAALPAAFHAGLLGVTAFRIGLPLGLAGAGWRDRGRVLPAALILVAAAAGEAGGALAGGQAEPAADAVAAVPEVAATSSSEIRWLTHLDVVGKALRTPLGVGLGRFETDYPLWRSAETLRAASHGYTTPETPVHKDPHDEPLLLLIECGWLGGLMALAGLVVLLRRPDRQPWCSAPLLALAVPVLVRAPLSDNPPALAFAAMLAGAVVLRSRPPADAAAPGAASPPEAAPGPPAPFLPRLGLPSLALLAALAAPAQIGGEAAVASHFRAPGGSALQAAVQWRPWDSRAWDFLAVQQAAAGAGLDEVRRTLQQALRHDPGDLFALDSLFTLELEAGRYPEALDALARAEQAAPGHPAVTDKRAWMRERLPAEVVRQVAAGDFLRALNSLTEAEGLAPEAPAVVAARTSLYRAWAASHRNAASALIQEAAEGRDFDAASSLKMRQHFLLAHLFDALAHAREGRAEDCRAALGAAATYADAQRGLVQRTARRQDLDEELVRVLLLRFDPGLEKWLGSAAGGAAAEPRGGPEPGTGDEG